MSKLEWSLRNECCLSISGGGGGGGDDDDKLDDSKLAISDEFVFAVEVVVVVVESE